MSPGDLKNSGKYKAYPEGDFSLRSEFYVHLPCLLRGAFFILTLLSGNPYCNAEDEAAIPSRVEEIEQNVAQYTHDLSEKREKQKTAEESYNRIKLEVRGMQARQAQIKKEFDEVKSQLDSILKDIELAADDIESTERKYAARIRALYMQRSENILENVFLISDQTTLRRNAYFMNRIRDLDKKIIDEIYVRKKDKESKIAALNSTLRQKEDLQDKINKQNKVLNDKLSEQETVINEISKQKSELEQTIASLKAQSLRIETVLTTLTGSDKPKAPPAKDHSIKQSLSGNKLEAFAGAGLEPVKGKIYVPVRGAELKSQASGEEVGKMLGVKGLTYSVEPESDVLAVADGRVIYNGKMPGRGNIVIIDHGQRYYSLYGKLSASEVRVQQDVYKGDVIARTEDNGSANSEFYFEIRKNGMAVDTRSFMRP